MPPPINNIGADSSITFAISGSELNEDVKASIGPKLGLFAHNISQGSKPLTRKTAIKMPHIKNHLLALLDIVPRTSALMIALSTLIIISKRANPKTINNRENKSILYK